MIFKQEIIKPDKIIPKYNQIFGFGQKENEFYKNYYAGKDCIIIGAQLPFNVDKNGNLL